MNHIEIGAVISRQAKQGAIEVGRFELAQRNVALIGRLEARRRRGHQLSDTGRLGAREHPAPTVDEIGGRKAVIDGQRVQIAAVVGRRFNQDWRCRLERPGHPRHPVADRLLSLLQIAPRDRRRVFDHCLHAGAEPIIDSARDQDAEEEGDDHRRRHGGEGEQGHETQMQSRAGVAIPLAQQAHQSPAQHRGQGGDQQKTQTHEQKHDGACRAERTDQAGRRPQADRRRRQDRRRGVATTHQNAHARAGVIERGRIGGGR